MHETTRTTNVMGRRSSLFFCSLTPKMFILKDLPCWDRVGSGQNLEPQGLTAKIFWNKDLSSAPRRLRWRCQRVHRSFALLRMTVRLPGENGLGEPSRM